jgi:hypothetical protein
VDPDPDPGGPKTFGSGGSGSATLERTMFHKIKGNLGKNAGNRGNIIIFFPLSPNIILIVS